MMENPQPLQRICGWSSVSSSLEIFLSQGYKSILAVVRQEAGKINIKKMYEEGKI